VITHWSERASDDVRRIYGYIAARNPSAALEMVKRFRKDARLLGGYPHIAREGVLRGTREWVTHPNYVMVYRVEDEDVYMIRLWHAARDEPNQRDLQ